MSTKAYLIKHIFRYHRFFFFNGDIIWIFVLELSSVHMPYIHAYHLILYAELFE